MMQKAVQFYWKLYRHFQYPAKLMDWRETRCKFLSLEHEHKVSIAFSKRFLCCAQFSQELPPFTESLIRASDEVIKSSVKELADSSPRLAELKIFSS